MRLWIILLLIGGFLLPLTAFAQQPMLVAGAEEAITRADTLGTKRNFDGAITVLKRSLDKYPTYERLYLSLVYWQEAAGVFAPFGPEGRTLDERKFNFRTNLADPKKPAYRALARDLFETCGQALMNVQDAQFVQRYAASLIYQDFPPELGQYGPLALPGDPSFYTYTLSDPLLPAERRGLRQCLITTKPWEIGPITDDKGDVLRDGYYRDPKYGQDPALVNDPVYGNWTFNRMITAYEQDPDHKIWILRFRIFWQDAPQRSAARQQLARNVAELLLRLSGLARAYGDFTPRFSDDGTMNVWLTEKGQAGGEAYNNNIYLQEVGTARTEAEWVREVAHEYGHSTLPVVGGYSKPEWAANGRLGERLFLRWLLKNPAPKTETHPWLRALNAAELTDARIDTPIKLFANFGPDAIKMHDNDSIAMDAFAGMALYLEQAYGSEFLTNVLTNMKTPLYGESNENGFRGMVELFGAEAALQPSILLRTADLPQKINYWVYLTEGAWRIELSARDDAPMQVKVEIDGKACKADAPDSYSTPPITKGWHRVRISPEGIIMPTITAIKLTKQ